MLLLIGFTLIVQILAGNSDVIKGTEKNWKQLLESKLPVFVKFFAPWCGHCKSLAPAWDKAATSLKGLVNIVHVDCNVEQQLCAKFDIKGYPTLKLFKNKGKYVKDYQQARDLNPIVKYAKSEIDDKVIKIKNEEALNAFLEKEPTLPHAILFSDKETAAPPYRALSCLFEGSIVLSQVASKVKAVVDKYGPFDKFPQLVVLRESGNQVFSGEFALAPLKEFLLQFGKISETAGDTTPSTPPPAPPKPAPPPKEPAAWKITTAEALDTSCQKSLCILALVELEATTNAAVASQGAILSETLAHFHAGSKFTFLYASKDDAALKSKFHLESSSGPSLIVYNAKKQKFARASAFESSVIGTLLERAVGGDLTYQPLSS